MPSPDRPEDPSTPAAADGALPTDPTDLDALKDEISREWLGRFGVSAVGVKLGDDGTPVVAVSLVGHDPGLVDRLRLAYRGRPVVVETGTGPIEFHAS